ncbi:hypothetical protein VM98_34345, partial [Streptomyces rubellomurinus subsp. indigoferus]
MAARRRTSPVVGFLYTPYRCTSFPGDTLFHGGPSATGLSYSHFPTITASIREPLLSLPAHTLVRIGHG